MELKTQLSRQIESVGEKDDIQKYDEHAKRILSNKYILSYILQRVVDELQGMSIPEIISCIEGEVMVSQLPLMPENILGENQEDSVRREGTIYFDLRFSVLKQQEKVKILFDLEAQKKYNPGYPIVTRGIVYGARMISKQIVTEFKI